MLPKAAVDESFHFYGKVLQGTPEQSARWKRAVAATNVALGEAVGKLYVERYFPPQAKAQVNAIVDALLKAFSRAHRHARLDGAGDQGRGQGKLATLKVGVGYPDHWLDYSGLRVVPGDAFGNADRAERFELARNLAKLGRPVDRGRMGDDAADGQRRQPAGA